MKGLIAAAAMVAGLVAAIPVAAQNPGGTGTGPSTGATTPTRPCHPPRAQASRHGRRGRTRACGHRRHGARSPAARFAARACRAERRDPGFAAAHGGKSFADYYGAPALRNCVRSKRAAYANAARACRAERAADPAAFRQKYGTNANRRNAFGKCVSQNAGGTSPGQTQTVTTT
jgi:hypothetical protein